MIKQFFLTLMHQNNHKNMKQLLCLILFILSFSSGKGQFTMHKMVTVGYAYQNQSFGEVGGKLLFLKTDDVIYRIGASALFGRVNSKFVAMPKIQGDILLNFEKNVDLYHSWYFLAGAEATNKYVAPKVGVTMFGLLDLTGGYAFSIDSKGLNGKKLDGLNINFTLNIPLVLLHEYLK